MLSRFGQLIKKLRFLRDLVMDNSIDHIIMLVPDLSAYMTEFEQVSGVKPKYGGMQLNAKIANALVDLGDGVYLEILGPSLNDSEVGPLTEWIRSREEPTVAWFALRSSNIEANAKQLEEAGLAHSGVLPTTFESSERRVSENTTIEWE